MRGAVTELLSILTTLGLALALSAVLVPISMTVGTRTGFVSKPRLFGSSERQIPSLGGIAIALAVGMGFAIVNGFANEMGAIAVGGGLAITLGLADDKVKALQPLVHHRLALQVVIALAAWFGGLRADEPGLVGLIATVAVLVAAMNAFNLLDNMDGVAGSTAAAAGAGIAILAALNGQLLVASLAAAVCGGCLGFLPYNFKNARVYLGNGGSLLLGFLLGGAALKLRLPLEQLWAVLATVVLLGVPATDTAVVVISRFRNKRGIMSGGTDHISHRLVQVGLTPAEAALAHGATTLLAAAIGALVVLYGRPAFLLVPLVLLACLGLALQRVDMYSNDQDPGSKNPSREGDVPLGEPLPASSGSGSEA